MQEQVVQQTELTSPVAAQQQVANSGFTVNSDSTTTDVVDTAIDTVIGGAQPAGLGDDTINGDASQEVDQTIA